MAIATGMPFGDGNSDWNSEGHSIFQLIPAIDAGELERFKRAGPEVTSNSTIK